MTQLKSLWLYLTRPANNLENFVDRQMSKMLASWLVSFLFILLILFFVRASGNVATQSEIWVRIILSFVLLIAFFINRRGHYQFACVLLVVVSSLVVIGLAYIESDQAGLQILNYLTVIILFASLFLPPWTIFAIFLLHVLGMIVYDLLIIDITSKQIIDGPLSFNLTLALIIFIITHMRQRLEIARRQKINLERQRFQHLATHSPDFICIINQSSLAIEFLNRDAFMGYPAAQFDSLHALFKIVHPQDLSQVTGFWQDVEQHIQDENNEIEFRIKCQSGAWEWVQNRVTTFNGHNPDTSPHFLSLMTIITERKQIVAAQKLESLGIMASGIAHDFNNLLVAILGQTELALRKLPPDNKARSHIEKAVSASNRAASITKQLLAYSGHGRFHISELSLNTLIQENIDLIQAACPKQIMFHIQLYPDLPRIEADAGQMQQLIMNLILNGAEAIGNQQGCVTITTSVEHVESSSDYLSTQYGLSLQTGAYVTLTIEDDGQGIDSQTLPHIFEPFFTTKEMGRGLGLSATLGIIRGHQGGISVQSKPGIGTTFKLLFPTIE